MIEPSREDEMRALISSLEQLISDATRTVRQLKSALATAEQVAGGHLGAPAASDHAAASAGSAAPDPAAACAESPAPTPGAGTTTSPRAASAPTVTRAPHPPARRQGTRAKPTPWSKPISTPADPPPELATPPAPPPQVRMPAPDRTASPAGTMPPVDPVRPTRTPPPVDLTLPVEPADQQYIDVYAGPAADPAPAIDPPRPAHPMPPRPARGDHRTPHLDSAPPQLIPAVPCSPGIHFTNAEPDEPPVRDVLVAPPSSVPDAPQPHGDSHRPSVPAGPGTLVPSPATTPWELVGFDPGDRNTDLAREITTVLRDLVEEYPIRLCGIVIRHAPDATDTPHTSPAPVSGDPGWIVLDRADLESPPRARRRWRRGRDRTVHCAVVREFARALDRAGGFRAREQAWQEVLTSSLRRGSAGFSPLDPEQALIDGFTQVVLRGKRADPTARHLHDALVKAASLREPAIRRPTA